jgi:hypothetical protein
MHRVYLSGNHQRGQVSHLDAQTCAVHPFKISIFPAFLNLEVTRECSKGGANAIATIRKNQKTQRRRPIRQKTAVASLNEHSWPTNIKSPWTPGFYISLQVRLDYFTLEH